MNYSSKDSKLPNRQLVAFYILAIVAVSTVLAVPFTAFQYLDLQYRSQHYNELQYIASQTTTSENNSVTEFGYHPTPWEIPVKLSSGAYFLFPWLITVAGSVACASLLQESRKKRYLYATLLAAILIPVSYLTDLPWGLFYWHGWEWYASLFFIGLYGFFAVFCAAILNGIYLLRSTHKQH